MKVSKLFATALATSLLLGTVSTKAQQHMQPGSGMMRNGMMGQMMGENCPMRGMMMGDADGTFADGRIAFLKAELQITDEQSDVFDAYSSAMKSNLEGMHSMRGSMMSMDKTQSAVERLETHIGMMEGRLESLKSLQGPLEALYSALGEEQKSKANKLLTGMGCMR